MSVWDWFKPAYVEKMERTLECSLEDNEALRRDLERVKRHNARLEREVEGWRTRAAHEGSKVELLQAQSARCKCRS